MAQQTSRGSGQDAPSTQGHEEVQRAQTPSKPRPPRARRLGAAKQYVRLCPGVLGSFIRLCLKPRGDIADRNTTTTAIDCHPSCPRRSRYQIPTSHSI